MRNDTYQVILVKRNRGWNASIANVREAHIGTLLFTTEVKTLKEARLKVESFYPVLTWVNNKKAYLVTKEEM